MPPVLFSRLRPPTRSTLFPYTTLFRSHTEKLGALCAETGARAFACNAADADEVERLFGAVERSEEHTSELQSRFDLVCRLLLEKKKKYKQTRLGNGQAQDTTALLSLHQ